MKKNSILSLLLFTLFFVPTFNVYAIEQPPVVQTKKSYLASLRAKFNAGIKRLRKAITIEDVETQRIVVKELFRIFRLILIAVGIGALIKYGVPYIGKEIDTRTVAFGKALDTRTDNFLKAMDEKVARLLKSIEGSLDVRAKATADEISKQRKEIFAALDLLIKAVEESADVRGRAIAREIKEQRKEILAELDERGNAMLKVADIRAKTVTEGVDERTAILLKELNEQIKILTSDIEQKMVGIMQKIHGAEIKGLGVSARINIPSLATQEEQKQKQPESEVAFEYMGRLY